ncbi:MAG: c-type cytochrome [Chromatiales bacterium]|nr:c-type cytochrome [Gammaproteobacteria bacterium]MCP5352111.1 c-type cytochrome [Chromatiales bacterium]
MRLLLLALVALTSPLASAWDALPETAPYPADNPPSAAKIELGKQLFFDPRFSATGTISCNSCHNLMAGGDDSRQTSMGVHGLTGPRNAPTVWNAAFHSVQFWDGRAKTLEDQAKGPVVAHVEMGMTDLDAAIARVRDIPGYVEQFAAVFGGAQPVTVDNAAKAVAAFERTLITPNSPYDRYVNGDTTALTEQQLRGMQAFADLGCVACHRGPAFNGPEMPGGVGFFISFPFHDSPYVEEYGLRDEPGRYAVTGNEADRHKYRVPTLRNIALTAPYFHNGRVKTLEEAVRVMAPSQLHKRLSDAQVADVVAFLNALTGPFPELTLPRLPPTPGRSVADPEPHPTP